METLEKFIEDHTIPGYGLKLLGLKDAIALVSLCKTQPVKLGGFDGFYLLPDGVQIEQLFSPDYSNCTKSEAIKRALEFFAKQEVTEGVGYEMVIVPEN